MAFKPLSTDFKDEILSEVNTQRKYKQTVNEDGTVSLQDMTAYEQEGSTYSAKDINEERQAINDIYANKVVSLEEAILVTEPGFFCDALVINETNKNLTDSLNSDFEVVATSYGFTVHHAQIGKFHLMRIAGNSSGVLTTHTITLPDKYKDGFFLSESGFAGNYRFLVEKNGALLKITSASGSLPAKLYLCKWLVYYG